GASALARPAGEARDRGPVLVAAQGRPHSKRRRAGRAAGVGALAAAAGRRPALRALQQVPGAKRCVQGSRYHGPDQLPADPCPLNGHVFTTKVTKITKVTKNSW